MLRIAATFFYALFVVVGTVVVFADDGSPTWKLREREEISDACNNVAIGFTFVPRQDAMYVGFYSYDHTMTIGRRAYDAERWELKKLPTKISSDSHNYIAMTFDSDDVLHVSGNMHASPLIYFRAKKPNDIESLEQVKSMVGDLENRCTYPTFLRDKGGRLIFTYRDGSSGNGNQIWNVYDEASKTWSRLLDKPLFDGQGQMNAYFRGPTLGTDGFFHVCWVWRDTPDAATNHDLSYVRSPDLIHWEKSNGEPCELPITIETGEIVDPVPAKGGILNSHVALSFDQENRVVLTYTKYDEKGRLQIWNARLENDGWRKVAATNWDFTWNFSGGGSLFNELGMSGVRVASPDKLALSWTQVPQNKSGVVYLDADTLEPCDAPPKSDVKRRPDYSPEDAKALNDVETNDERLHAASATSEVNGERWVFRWERPDANRDRPIPGDPPEPTTFRVFKFERNQ
ncbi:MAG: BNR repeat-containing protein [Thermoguttaceae bacterium]|nr:BNR repeat-containing protein [Thermoguttaceae bacterium]